MRIFKTKEFTRFARKEGTTDRHLVEAVARLAAGHVDADLGGGVVKQRLARPGQGRSGGFRVVLFYRAASRLILVAGFAKSARANIGDEELTAFKWAARLALTFSDGEINTLLEARHWQEIDNG